MNMILIKKKISVLIVIFLNAPVAKFGILTILVSALRTIFGLRKTVCLFPVWKDRSGLEPIVFAQQACTSMGQFVLSASTVRPGVLVSEYANVKEATDGTGNNAKKHNKYNLRG